MTVIWLSTLLLSTCGASAALGAYSFQGIVERRLNRLFLAFCGGTAVWAFGFAIVLGAETETVSALGHRLASLGWGANSCLILLFFLDLTGQSSMLKKWWRYPLFFLPSVLSALSFGVLPFLGVRTTSVNWTASGWVVVFHGVWLWIYCLQVLSFMLTGLWLLLRWARRAASPAVWMQAVIMMAAFAAAAFFSVLTDVAPGLRGVLSPQLSPVFILIPLVAIAHLIRRYHFLQAAQDPNDMILTVSARTRAYLYLGLITLACAVLNQAFCGSFRETSAQALPFTGVLSAAALCLLAVNLIRLDGSLQELIVALCFSFVIPLSSLWSTRTGNLTVWAFAFPLMIGALLFNRLIVLTTIVTSSFLTQAFIWSYQPVTFMRVSAPAYFVRLAALFATLLLALYVHRMYIRRLKENANHIVKQSLVSKASHSFISAGEEDIGDTLYTTLEGCGHFIRCDRGYLILLEDDGKTIRYSREWMADGIVSGMEAFENSIEGMAPMLKRQSASGQPIILKDTRLLPPMAREAKRQLARLGIRALVVIPIRNDSRTIGFLGFNAGIPFRKWNLEDASFLCVIAGLIGDAVLKVEAEKKINFIAYHDQLTGLPNRLLFNERLAHAIPLAERTEKLLAVAFIDLDSFKSVNDTMGHDLGDQLLASVAQALSGSVRGYDTVARFGGDEFILLLNQISGIEDVLRVMDKLMKTLQRAFLLNGQELFITASAGVALYPQDGRDAETLIKNADTTMYHVKGTGKNHYALCSPDIKNSIFDKMRLSNLLYRALEKEQLTLYYQPQVELESRSIIGCEALVRWNLPDRGIVMPAVFIPLAEQTGLIQAIGAWVLETACRQNMRWHALGFTGLRMAVNISVHQLRNPKFVSQVGEILSRTGLPPQLLELEVTESVANGANIDSVVDVLNQLKALGVSISIDDFGKEYSSLSRLKQLPVDRIKMDMQFVQGIEKSEKDQAISKVIISLAKSLDLKVIAEGVETGPQLDFLRQKMCDEVQGFFYYKPMPAEQLETVLLEQARQSPNA